MPLTKVQSQLLGTGTVLQVVQTVTNTETASSTNSYVDVTGLAATITPTSATSKILVNVQPSSYYNRNSQSTTYGDIFLAVVRGSTQVYVMRAATGWGFTTWGDTLLSPAICYLDSPATTSQITYKIQMSQTQTGTLVKVNASGIYNSTITLMEIAG